MSSRVIIAGGRDLPITNKVVKCAAEIVDSLALTCHLKQVTLLSGTAKGADQIPYKLNWPVEEYPAKWQREDGSTDRAAGIKRNILMAENATHLLAFWDGKSKGTAHMISYAKKIGLKVKVVRYKTYTEAELEV